MSPDKLSIEELADAMYEMVKESAGMKKFKSGDLTKAMIERFGQDRCDRASCKKAIRSLIDSERCVYTYFGGSFIEIPHEEGAAKDNV
jgi:mannitol/fructose-specific phosphotransferase system IIA component